MKRLEIEEKEIFQMKNYFRVPNVIFEQKLSSIEFVVLCYLLKCRNTVTGRCFPSRKNIAKACCIAESSVSKAIKALNERGLIKIIPCYVNNRQRNNQYEILL